ncbi:ABC transporter permease [Aquitalea magnusonii]|jgi:D-methionine transport system permease protein|uniref:Methionine ABC transporter permease protein n=1 Tax=Aquitalea magnusonii TaxID=332411 RepID=A0A0F3K7C0_9NEIS|nr:MULTISPECIES: methionine ABC transporter permease [Aquitalea]KJV26882.1 ABC transporter permease [Aquitalea magnusonii]BBF85136.1 methionine ABC transporter permease protein [Aquitalea magnusonii]
MPDSFDLYLTAAWQTLQMVSVSALVSAIFGLALALLLVTTGPGDLYARPWLNRGVGSVVNVFRSVPFIILLVVLLPFTRLVVGTTIGVWAAVVPLSVAGIPFFARIAEVSLREVDRGLIEAVQAMGGRKRDVLWHVLLPEALPGIVSGLTITLVAMIGSSAMAGAVGAGGLGDVAIRYGYQRFDTQVMVSVLIGLVVLVSVVQTAGDVLARRLNHRQ